MDIKPPNESSLSLFILDYQNSHTVVNLTLILVYFSDLSCKTTSFKGVKGSVCFLSWELQEMANKLPWKTTIPRSTVLYACDIIATVQLFPCHQNSISLLFLYFCTHETNPKPKKTETFFLHKPTSNKQMLALYHVSPHDYSISWRIGKKNMGGVDQ